MPEGRGYKYARMPSGEVIAVDPLMVPDAVGLMDEPPSTGDPLLDNALFGGPGLQVPAPVLPPKGPLERAADEIRAGIGGPDPAAQALPKPAGWTPPRRPLDVAGDLLFHRTPVAPPTAAPPASDVLSAQEAAAALAAQTAAAPQTTPAAPGVPAPPARRPVGLKAGQRAELAAMEEAASERKKAAEQVAGEVEGILTGAAAADRRMAREQEVRDRFTRDRLQKLGSVRDRIFGEFVDSDLRDPWASASAGSQMLGTFGVILGELAKGYGAADNAGLKIMDSYIEREVDRQRTMIAKKGREFDMADSLYQRARQEGLDDQQAANLARAAHWGWADRQVAIAEQKASGPVIKAAYADARAEIQNRRNAFLAENEKAEALRADREYDNAIQAAALRAKQQAAGRPALSKEEQRDVRKKQSEYLGVKAQADELMRFAETRWVGDEAIEAEAAWGIFKNALIKSFMGNATEAEVARMEETVKRDPNAIRTDAFKAQMRGILRIMSKKATGELKPYGESLEEFADADDLAESDADVTVLE